MTSPNKEHWLDAERKEMTGLWGVGAWIWAKCPYNVRPIMSKWTYALKPNAEGVIQDLKQEFVLEVIKLKKVITITRRSSVFICSIRRNHIYETARWSRITTRNGV